MDLTKSKGNITELNCIIKFMEMGFDCSIPYGDSSKYDFIADINGKLIKVQCKSCSNPISKNKESLGEKDLEAIQFKCCAQTTNTKKTIRHTYSKEDIDYFATYYEGNVYLIPVEECSSSKILRFSPPMNNIQNYNKAENYLIEKVLGEFQNKNFLLQKEEENKNIKK